MEPRMPHLTPCYDQNLISQYEFYFMIMMYHNIVIFTEKRVLQYIFYNTLKTLKNIFVTWN